MSSRDVRVAGTAFAFIFTAYNTAQNYMTTLLGPKLGSACLVLVYTGLICVTPFAPGMVPRLGLPKALALGGSSYALLMIVLLLRASSALSTPLSTALVLLFSFTNGIGGSLLWSAQGSLVILESQGGDNGRNAGDFWALFHTSTIIGNAWAFFAFGALHSSATALFAIFATIATLGCCILACCLRPRERIGLAAADGSADSGPQEPSPQPLAPSRAIPRQRARFSHRLCDAAVSEAREMRRLLWSAVDLSPLLLLGGCLMSYQFGVFPLVLRKADVGFVFAIFGVAEVVGAYAAGRCVDRLSEWAYLLLTMALTTLSLVLALPLAVEEHSLLSLHNASLIEAAQIRLDDPGSFFLPALAAAAFGASDSAIAVLAYAQLGRRFRDKSGSARAGACRQVFYSIGFLIGFGVGPYVPGVAQLLVLLMLLCVAWAVLSRGNTHSHASATPPTRRGVGGSMDIHDTRSEL
jgi:hypothetical protein